MAETRGLGLSRGASEVEFKQASELKERVGEDRKKCRRTPGIKWMAGAPAYAQRRWALAVAPSGVRSCVECSSPSLATALLRMHPLGAK